MLESARWGRETRLIPLKDENPTRTFPSVVILLIAANVVAYLYQSLLPDSQQQQFVYTYGAIPVLLLGKAKLSGLVPLAPIWLSVFTAMFLHGGLLHLGSNMLYLWIFGNNVEDTLGHFRFLVFYLLCGLIAAGAQVALSMNSAVPMIGASGAIAGVLGAYYVKFPTARIRTLVLLLPFITVVMLPASLVLILWFLLQVLQSVGSLGASSARGGVAVFAHVGGFVAGWVLVRRFEPRRGPRPMRWE